MQPIAFRERPEFVAALSKFLESEVGIALLKSLDADSPHRKPVPVQVVELETTASMQLGRIVGYEECQKNIRELATYAPKAQVQIEPTYQETKIEEGEEDHA